MSRIPKSNKPLENIAPFFDDKIGKTSYSATTNDIEITVWPEFVDNQISPIGNLFIWAYQVRIENRSLEKIKLINRHWRIIDEKGTIQEVDGEGVVGEKPEIAPNNFFNYTSGVHLTQPSGIMSGHYQMQKEDGQLINVAIPSFSLDVPSVKKVIN